MKKIFLILLSGLLLLTCKPPEPKFDPNDGLEALTEAGLEARIEKISSDEFMGRMPFTEGETRTIAYLQDEVKKLGLEPGNGTSYLQEVPMVRITTKTDSVMKVVGKKN